MIVALRGCVCVFVTRVSPIGSGGESGVFGAPEDGEGLGGDVTREHRRLGGGGCMCEKGGGCREG